MDICYGCMHPFPHPVAALPLVEDPVITSKTASLVIKIREVGTSGGRDMYTVHLQKREGSCLHVGRSKDNDIVIIQPTVSRHHMRIFFSQDALWAEDKGSTNMTYIDGVPLVGVRRLDAGTVLSVGATRITVENRACDEKWVCEERGVASDERDCDEHHG